MSPQKTPTKKEVEVFTHDDASRRNLPTAEFQSVMAPEVQKPIRVEYERRNPDLDPQLIWRGKYDAVMQSSNLAVPAPPLYIQEKVHPKAIIDDLRRRSRGGESEAQTNLFADFNGLPNEDAKTEFYQHEAHWSNRMILGDSLQVMASLAEREGLRGKVQCIYLDPPYGIKFNSNFQWSTTSRDVKDGNLDHITREPEQVKAFRDTWRDGIHSYLSYLRDRFAAAHELLADTGSIFVQIGDENVHRVRAVMDEVFGPENLISQIAFRTTTGRAGEFLSAASNYLLWFARKADSCKYRPAYQDKRAGSSVEQMYSLLRLESGTVTRMTTAQIKNPDQIPRGARQFGLDNLTSSRPAGERDLRRFAYQGSIFTPGKGTFKTEEVGMRRLSKGSRIWPTSNGFLRYVRFIDDFPVIPISNIWIDTGTGSFTEDKLYVVQTGTKVIERCLLMATDPGDLVLDPTCGSGTTAYVAEQWGRRWITIDTSRVALALARARIMGARYQYYLLADSPEGQKQEAKLTGRTAAEPATGRRLNHGFVYERVPHITLRSIANNSEIDVIWEEYQKKLEPLREKLNETLKQSWEEWQIPREAGDPWDENASDFFWALHQEIGPQRMRTTKSDELLRKLNASLGRAYKLETLSSRPYDPWPEGPTALHAAWWGQLIARQKAIDASIAAKAEFEYLYDKPYDDKTKVRVAGPFTVESLSPHRVLAVNENDELVESAKTADWDTAARDARDFAQVILETLRTAGVQQAHKEDRITFSSLVPWPGSYICAEGRYEEADGTSRRAGILIGPEFGTLTREDLVLTAREAGDANFDVVIACAFAYDAQSAELNKLGRIRVLKARMNADLHMATDLKNTGKGNLFVIFGEPDIELATVDEGEFQVIVRGVDVFQPSTGEVRSSGPEGIACWFLDTDYNEESFFVRHAYFLGAGDPYKSLKTTLKAEINEEAWASLNSATSRPFTKPSTGRIAVKVINHLGDEVMKVLRVP
jgi:adenine-specific DNA-methyltransferase